TSEGRARLALVAAIGQLPGAIDPEKPMPTTLRGRLHARIGWLQFPFTPLAFGIRGQVEALAGGDPSANGGGDYAHLLQLSKQGADVRALYKRAGLSLEDDLATLAAAPRITADDDAVRYLTANASFTGDLTRPVLTLHNTQDGAAPASHEQAYA